MARHFHEELKTLKEEILRMGLLVEEAIDKAVRALLTKDQVLAQQVFLGEETINTMEIKIDAMGHNLLALDQPMAIDMRVITAVLKINTDLERMGDHAVNIAERAMLLVDEPRLDKRIHIPEMSEIVQQMLRDALISFVNEDTLLAKSVLMRDDEVDDFNDSLYLKLQELMEKNPEIIKSGMLLARVGHDLERIADLTNNLVEDVIYMKQGKEVRHHIETPD